ncbi:hypothetical protein Cs7R123_06340 [Catellatospora sp. TT07R-123]|nr:hypothetical protein Cs7R123_06340 [Catellatospora sp. TT07R-123]
MAGSFNNGRNDYRCTYAAEYAGPECLAHPRSVYLREDKIIELFGTRVGQAFSPSSLQNTLLATAESQHNDLDQYKGRAARDKITACNAKLERYRVALEVGTDPVLVQQWIAETQAAKSIAESELRALIDAGPYAATPESARRSGALPAPGRRHVGRGSRILNGPPSLRDFPGRRHER